MIDRTDRHLVIGAGFAGLGVAAAFTRHGIAYDQVEADVDVGGNWRHGVYETVHIISSRKTTEYKDWPMPADWPDFPSAEQMRGYLEAYADHWGLRPRIEFETRAAWVEPVGDGRWRVTIEHAGAREVRLYGGVVVCNGHHWDPRWPSYPGQDGFTGELIHAKQYRSPAILAGKRVLVIGGGNSACDIAVEAARFAASSHVSHRRGYWFLPKTMMGVPTAELMRGWIPARVQRRIIKTMLALIVGDYQKYGLQHPDHELFEHHPTINTELLHHLRHGSITPHPDIARFDGGAVEFVDGTRADFDLVVCATGYHVSFPFLAPGIVDFRGEMAQLVGGILPPRHKNLYVFGLGQPRYGAGPLITAGADVLCTMVATQRELAHPLGDVMRRMGARPPRTYLADPFQVMRSMKMAKRILPRLPAVESWIMPR